MPANGSCFTLIVVFSHNVAKAMLLKKDLIRTENPKFSVLNKKLKSLLKLFLQMPHKGLKKLNWLYLFC
ncbi:hypothetical protein B9C57_13960 [Tenacibaculum maritimum]|nr:hypothetical protein B9C57_13960 [Tenacibaculum maritimum]